MSILIDLPTPQTPPLAFYDVQAVLEDVTYTLRFQWNERDDSWFLTVLDNPGQVTLMAPWRVVVDYPLFRALPDRTPPGYFLAFDTSGKAQDPGIADLGARVQLYLVTAAEVAALKAA